MTITTSRRALMAGTAALATGAVATVTAIIATHAAEPDPIFALIEQHKAAWYRRAELCGKLCGLVSSDPDYEGVDRAHDSEIEAFDEASWALVETLPETIGGMAALLDYVEEFNGGALETGNDHSLDSSEAWMWPAYDDEYTDDAGSSFMGGLLRHVAEFLKAHHVTRQVQS